MKYKVGDKVRIREDLKVGKEYDEATVVENMKRYFGKTTTIRDVYEHCYTLDVDNGDWIWTDDMFEDGVEKVKEESDIKEVKNVDIGYYLEYCGHRVIKNVYYGGYAHDHNHIFCTTDDSLNQYTLPINSIEFIIPHEDYDMVKESKEYE